ncbi:hypothetical protein, partial [Prescottella agglutinans]
VEDSRLAGEPAISHRHRVKSLAKKLKLACTDRPRRKNETISKYPHHQKMMAWSTNKIWH